MKQNQKDLKARLYLTTVNFSWRVLISSQKILNVCNVSCFCIFV